MDKSSGYITIPDKYVMYTDIKDEETGARMSSKNVHEGQTLVKGLQKLDDKIDQYEIDAP